MFHFKVIFLVMFFFGGKTVAMKVDFMYKKRAFGECFQEVRNAFFLEGLSNQSEKFLFLTT